MPRKQEVVEQQPEVIEPTVVETTIDETTIETTLPPEAPPVLADEAAAAATTPDEVKEVKVKPKRKAQPKKIKVQEIEEVKEQTPTNIPKETKEIKEEPTNQKKVKTLEQVKCDTCEKDMTKRTFRYHHKCPGEVIKREEIPVKKRVKKETSPKPKEETKAPEKPTLTNTYQERLQKALEKRSETMQKLASQIV